MLITRQQMIERVRKNFEGYSLAAEKAKGFSKWGTENRRNAARALLQRLENGTEPTTHEVVGYFGKGARFSA